MTDTERATACDAAYATDECFSLFLEYSDLNRATPSCAADLATISARKSALERIIKHPDYAAARRASSPLIRRLRGESEATCAHAYSKLHAVSEASAPVCAALL